jgi:hypothetical protein
MKDKMEVIWTYSLSNRTLTFAMCLAACRRSLRFPKLEIQEHRFDAPEELVLLCGSEMETISMLNSEAMDLRTNSANQREGRQA